MQHLYHFADASVPSQWHIFQTDVYLTCPHPTGLLFPASYKIVVPIESFELAWTVSTRSITTQQMCVIYLTFHVHSTDVNEGAMHTRLTNWHSSGRLSFSYYLVGSQADHRVILGPFTMRARPFRCGHPGSLRR